MKQRMQFKDRVRPLTDHALFDNFISARVNAFARGKTKRKKRG